LMLGPLRMAQVVSSLGILLGLVGLAWLYLLKRPLPDVVPTPKGNGEMRG
jgi:phosphatidylglycerol---prolipoprotein diacylglyceryl transferase